MRPAHRFLWLSVPLFWLGTLGCAPPDLHRVKVSGPSGLFDGRASHLAVGALEGPADPTFQAELRRSLAKLPAVTVYDHPLMVPRATPPRSCVLSASIQVDAREEQTTNASNQPVVKTTVTTDLRYRVDDLSTGLLLQEGTHRQEDQEEAEVPKKEPGKSTGQKLLEGTLTFVARTTFDILLGRKSTLEIQREAVLKDLRKDLSLHKEASTFWLCSDSDLPGLTEGIEAAKADGWQAAAEHFQQALDARPGHPRLLKAHYDLGIALLALGRLESAREHLLQARALLQGTSHGLSPRDLPSYVERNEAALAFGLLLERRQRWAKGEPL